jgi:hypothetical protein
MNERWFRARRQKGAARGAALGASAVTPAPRGTARRVSRSSSGLGLANTKDAIPLATRID